MCSERVELLSAVFGSQVRTWHMLVQVAVTVVQSVVIQTVRRVGLSMSQSGSRRVAAATRTQRRLRATPFVSNGARTTLAFAFVICVETKHKQTQVQVKSAPRCQLCLCSSHVAACCQHFLRLIAHVPMHHFGHCSLETAQQNRKHSLLFN